MPSHNTAVSGGTAAYLAILILPLLAHYGVNFSIEQQAAFTGLVTALIGYLPSLVAWLFPGKPPFPLPNGNGVAVAQPSGDQPHA